MRPSHLKHFAVAAALVAALAAPSPCRAQPGVGTWVRQTEKSANGGMTMVVELCCNGGRRLTYRLTGARTVMMLESPFDGSDAALLIDGKPSGETMAISRVDARHTLTILKLNGRKFGTSIEWKSASTLSGSPGRTSRRRAGASQSCAAVTVPLYVVKPTRHASSPWRSRPAGPSPHVGRDFGVDGRQLLHRSRGPACPAVRPSARAPDARRNRIGAEFLRCFRTIPPKLRVIIDATGSRMYKRRHLINCVSAHL